MLAIFRVLLFVLATVHAASVAERRDGALSGLAGGGSWSHPQTHPSSALFKRQSTMPPVGSAEWRRRYPSNYAVPPVAMMPDAWRKALNALEASGEIPNVPRSIDGKYPAGVNAGSPAVCSSAAGCRGDKDIWDAPNGVIGLSFDDGPTPNSPALFKFLKSQNQEATHFFIGGNILDNPNIFAQAFEYGGDIAVHTWSHHHMSSLSNEDIVSELGWTLQIISDLTGGRIARYWRPPYGDSDNRVRAIAENIFGLIQVDWNRDTDDWHLDGQDAATSIAKIDQLLTTWVNGKKAPGLIILEHELFAPAVQAFVNIYPLMKSTGWNVRSISQLAGESAYQNAEGGTGDVTPMNLIASTAPTGTPAAAIPASAIPTSIEVPSSAASATISAPNPSGSSTSNGASILRPLGLPGIAVIAALALCL